MPQPRRAHRQPTHGKRRNSLLHAHIEVHRVGIQAPGPDENADQARKHEVSIRHRGHELVMVKGTLLTGTLSGVSALCGDRIS